jgi:Fe-S-cluster formation regulator IscX/YfhJ
MILRGIARACKKIYFVMPHKDEVGNPIGVNPWTGVNIQEYYSSICEEESCEYEINPDDIKLDPKCILFCDLRPWLLSDKYITLASYFPDKCKYGLLGSNKANEETLKLFPSEKAIDLVHSIKWGIKDRFGVDVEVMVYGDGCFKDPIGGIWEFADPVTSPAYTSGLNGSPNEIKLKAFADDQFANLSGENLMNAIKNEIKLKEKNLVGNMHSQGTTPRRYVDLLASLMDLTSGSGYKGTPVVVVKNYFKNYSC